jgi:hypothetical protein
MRIFKRWYIIKVVVKISKKGGNKMKFVRKGELRDATEELVVSIEVEIDKTEKYLSELRKERLLLKSKLEEEGRLTNLFWEERS